MHSGRGRQSCIRATGYRILSRHRQSPPAHILQAHLDDPSRRTLPDTQNSLQPHPARSFLELLGDGIYGDDMSRLWVGIFVQYA